MLADVTTNLTPPRYFPRSNAAASHECHSANDGFASRHLPLFPEFRRQLSALREWPVGDGNWDRAAYFRTNHPSTALANRSGTWTRTSPRYQTYLWEAEDATRLPDPDDWHDQSLWRAAMRASRGSAGSRRRGPTAHHCCGGQLPFPEFRASTEKRRFPVAGFIDVFLVEPSVARTRCNGCSSFTLQRQHLSSMPTAARMTSTLR